MKIFQKPQNRDFVILNLSDPQMNGFEWEDGHPYAPIVKYTIDQLIEHNRPDLITVTGDMAYPGQLDSYEIFAQLLDPAHRNTDPVSRFLCRNVFKFHSLFSRIAPLTLPH